jgi:hypothetical protein
VLIAARFASMERRTCFDRQRLAGVTVGAPEIGSQGSTDGLLS